MPGASSSLKHLRYQGCAKLLLTFFSPTCLCFESVTSLFPSYFLLFSCCSFIFFFGGNNSTTFSTHIDVSLSHQHLWRFLLDVSCFHTPGILVQTNGLDYQCNGHLANQWAQGITSYGEVVEGPVITLPILPKWPFIGAQGYFIL